MELVIGLVTLLLGLAVGAFIVWFAKDGQTQQAVSAAQGENLATIAALEEKAAGLSAREGHLSQELAASRQEFDQRRAKTEEESGLLRQELARLREEQVQLQGQLLTERQIAAEKARLLGELEQRFAHAIGTASQQAIETASERAAATFTEKLIESSSQSFLGMAKTALDELRPLVESMRAESGAAAASAVDGAGGDSVRESRSGLRGVELAEMVKPLDETLRKVEEQLREMERGRSGEYQELLERVRELGESQTALRAEAGRLANALRTPVQRGLWGEVQLRRVVEMAGMLEHCEFRMAAPPVSAHQERVDSLQAPGTSIHEVVSAMDETVEIPVAGAASNGNGSNGSRRGLLVDLTVHLPGARRIAVNAQVPVNAYLDALAAGSETEREERMAMHAAGLREHVDRLNAALDLERSASQPDFVVAFLPGEAFLSAALAQDAGLLEYSLNRRVLLTTPTTLVSLLKTASYGWTQESVAENARQVRELGRELYERLRVLTGHFNGIKRGLETTLRAYNDAAGSMENRVLSTARRFRELGAANGNGIEPPQGVSFSPREIHMPELRALVGAPSSNGDGD